MYLNLARNWWLLALRGSLAILFGMLAFMWPELARLYILISFAAYAFLDGIFSIVAAIYGQRQGWWWALILEGIVGISAGVITIAFPGITQLALLYVIAFWAMVTGVFEIVAALRLRRVLVGEWALGLSGFLSILFGIALVVMPVAGALAVAWLIASFSIVFGILLLVLASRLRTGRYMAGEGFAESASRVS